MEIPFMILPLVLVLFFAFGCKKQDEDVASEKEAAPSIVVDNAISVDGISIAYEVVGEGEPALVFVHGWCCNRGHWSRQLPYFGEKHKAVAIDLAGHGDSGLDRKVWTMGAFGEDVIAVVNKLNHEKTVLIGHSWGALVVLEAARRMPQRVIGLVGVDYLRDFEFRFSEEYLRNFFSSFRSDFMESMKNSVSAMFTSNSDPVLIDEIVKDMASTPPEVGLRASEVFTDFVNNEMIPALSEVTAPITCINSDMNPTNVETNQRYVPSFKAKIMSGIGHFNMMEDPETFNRLLEETIQEFVQMAESK